MTGGTIVCGCGRLLDCARVGVVVEEVDEAQNPYKLWSCDQWTCPECGTTIYSHQLGQRPLSEHWHLSYAEQAARAVLQARCREETRNDD
jgi:hypothetical protein